ncbi:MAG TPA: hypothetical protein VHG71_03125 [Verrucomicrobiae bacterium]|nr:hypothetical protein [Verrucomicrobiae bacterium]
MKRLAQLGDFLLGALLIGGAPLCFLMLSGIAYDYCYDFTHRHPNATLFGYDADLWGQAVVSWVFWGLAILVFALAIRHRKRHRILPSGALQFEVVAGIIGAVIFIAATFRRF